MIVVEGEDEEESSLEVIVGIAEDVLGLAEDVVRVEDKVGTENVLGVVEDPLGIADDPLGMVVAALGMGDSARIKAVTAWATDALDDTSCCETGPPPGNSIMEPPLPPPSGCTPAMDGELMLDESAVAVVIIVIVVDVSVPLPVAAAALEPSFVSEEAAAEARSAARINRRRW